MFILCILGIIVLVVGAIFFFIDYAKGGAKKVSYIIMVVGLVLAAGGYFGNQYEIHQAQVRQAKIKQQKEKTFADNYSNIRYYALEVGTSAEKIGNKYVDVWHDAIWEDSGVTIDGKTYTDFNKAIQAQYNVYTNNGTIDDMDANLASLESTYKKLTNNVTAKNTEKLAKAKKTVTDAKAFVNTVEDPSGNYGTFSNKVSENDSALGNDL